jgi:hypothetical protein
VDVVSEPTFTPNRDGYDYVRECYGVEVEIGQHVVIDGTPCVIVQGENDQYLHFTPNGGRNFLIAHPNWRVDYHPGDTEAH